MNQKKEIEVSIVCITFNHEKYIRKTLDGFLMQKTKFSYEIIVHDDASTDGTKKILQEYQRKYPDKITLLLEKENQYSKGKSLLKLCFPKVNGKYIAISDGDDEWIYEKKLQEQYNLLEQNPNISFCSHNVIKYNIQTDERIAQIKDLKSGILDDEEIILGHHGWPPTTSFFFRSKYVSGIPEFSYHASVEDEPIRYYYACKGDMFYIDEIWAVRNFMHEGSWNYSMKNRSARLDYTKKYLTYLVEFNNYSHRKFNKFLHKRIFQLCFGAIELLQPGIKDNKELERIIDVLKKEMKGKFDENLNEVYESVLPTCLDYLDEKIIKFIDECEEKKGELYLYGTGEVAKCFAKKLEYMKYSFKGFVVSENHKKMESFMNRRIWNIVELDTERSYIWLTLNEKNIVAFNQ